MLIIVSFYALLETTSTVQNQEAIAEVKVQN